MSKRYSGQTSRGGIPGPCPFPTACTTQTRIFPPSEDYAPKKVTSAMPLECISRPETPKIMVITTEFANKNRFFFADFAVKTFFLFSPQNPRISRMLCDENLCFLVFTLDKFFVPPKIVYAPPPSHATLALGLATLMILFCMIILNM